MIAAKLKQLNRLDSRHRGVMGKIGYVIALAALFLGLGYNYYFTYDYVHVTIDKGVIRGFKTTTWRGVPFFSFKGIPYAQPPLGKLRFKAPQEETAWSGVRDAVSHGSICPQLDVALPILRGDEDCLFINVYTPSLGSERLSVMFWIHGGGFEQGSANDEIYGPDYFMGTGVILVTVNYRLGALGFLSSGDDDAPGNTGLKDQAAALRWVKRNIARFGGDPEKVTIFGESAGSACVHYHILSPMSAGLFSRAIGQSGSSLNNWAYTNDGAAVTIRLAEYLGAKNLGQNTKRAVDFLRTAPYSDIVKAQQALKTPEEVRIRKAFLFVPTVEKGVKSEEVFMPDSPLNLLKSGNFNKVPFITGYNSHEGYFFTKAIAKPEIRKMALEDTERYVPQDIKNEVLRNELATSIRKFYFKDKPVHPDKIDDFVNLHSDITFIAGTNLVVKLLLRHSQAPIYYYVFEYTGKLNLVKFILWIEHLPGASHGDDLGYLFYQRILFWRKPVAGSDDEHVINTMIRLWTNFAKYGNPTPNEDPLTWKPVTPDEFNFLNISGRDTRLQINPNQERLRFWDEAYQKSTIIDY
ncbi:esterase E4-like [Neodiprion fabricii]|uniref:esterase E4-like n=1 Tax=Neodiprion fabricii TaxID=2872261 RepID=UPI001ED96875|nr:esterase E4-like [Neodiprion fabricii]